MPEAALRITRPDQYRGLRRYRVAFTLSEKIAEQGFVEAKEAKRIMATVRAYARAKPFRRFPKIFPTLHEDGTSEALVDGKVLTGPELTAAYVAEYCETNRFVNP